MDKYAIIRTDTADALIHNSLGTGACTDGKSIVVRLFNATIYLLS